MSHRIVKQPNGRYAIWSWSAKDFVMVNATETEVIANFVERAYVFCNHSFEEYVEMVRKQHGPDSESLQMLGLAEKGKGQ